MMRTVNGRALRRLLERGGARAPAPPSTGRGFASASRIATGAIAAPLASRALASRVLAPMTGSLLPASVASIAGRSTRAASTFLTEYDAHVAERATQNIAPKPLDAKQVASLCEQLESPPSGDEAVLMDLFENRVPPGAAEAASQEKGHANDRGAGDRRKRQRRAAEDERADRGALARGEAALRIPG